MSLHRDDLSPREPTMTNVPNSIAAELLTSTPAANDDRIEETTAPASVSLSATGGWDAHEVWRRFIKDPRERRWAEQPPEF
jgi:hypothetical protein